MMSVSFIGGDSWEVPNPQNVVNEEGLVALSLELTPDMYVRMYPYGMFPWFEQEELFFWFSPGTRSITYTEELKVSKSMRPYLNSEKWSVTVNHAFEDVVALCKKVPRPGQMGTWISGSFEAAFNRLHQLGLAHSFEVWDGSRLIGGAFGTLVGNVFVGESMFHRVNNASKLAYIGMTLYMREQGVKFIDNQLPTDHLNSLGASNLDRISYLDLMKVHAHQVMEKKPIPPAQIPLKALWLASQK